MEIKWDGGITLGMTFWKDQWVGSWATGPRGSWAGRAKPIAPISCIGPLVCIYEAYAILLSDKTLGSIGCKLSNP